MDFISDFARLFFLFLIVRIYLGICSSGLACIKLHLLVRIVKAIGFTGAPINVYHNSSVARRGKGGEALVIPQPTSIVSHVLAPPITCHVAALSLLLVFLLRH